MPGKVLRRLLLFAREEASALIGVLRGVLFERALRRGNDILTGHNSPAPCREHLVKGHAKVFRELAHGRLRENAVDRHLRLRPALRDRTLFPSRGGGFTRAIPHEGLRFGLLGLFGSVGGVRGVGGVCALGGSNGGSLRFRRLLRPR